MQKFTVTSAADPDLAGVPAVIIGVDKETAEMVLRFEEGSSLIVRSEHVTLMD